MCTSQEVVTESHTVSPEATLSHLSGHFVMPISLQDSVMPSQEPAVDDKDDGLPSEDTDGSMGCFLPAGGAQALHAGIPACLPFLTTNPF